MTEICGMTPLLSVLRKKISPYPAREFTPSWILAPPESLIPISGIQFEGIVHNLGYLAGVHASQRTSGNGEVLRINSNRLAVDLSCSDYHAVSGKVFLLHAEFAGVVLNKQVVLVEGSLVKEFSDTLSGRK